MRFAPLALPIVPTHHGHVPLSLFGLLAFFFLHVQVLAIYHYS